MRSQPDYFERACLLTLLLTTVACSERDGPLSNDAERSGTPPASAQEPPPEDPPLVGTYAPWENFAFPHHLLNEEAVGTRDPCIKDPLLEPDDPRYVGYIDVPAYCVEIYGKANLVVGETTELQCWGYAQRNPLIGQPAWPVSANRPRTWSSQNPNEVSVNTQTAFWKNTIQAVAPGATRVQCSIDGKVGSIKITVSAPPPTLQEVRVEGPTLGNAFGLTMPFTTKLTARAIFSDGTTQVVNSTATWQITDPSVATIAPGGYMTVYGWGVPAYVTATYQGMPSAARQVHYGYVSTFSCEDYGVPC